jgi:hypothetical protein
MNTKSKLNVILFFALLIPALNYAQITGKVVDDEKNPVEFAAVAVINPLDSTLIDYTSTNKHGLFDLKKVSNGKHIFQINLVGFKTYQKMIEFNGDPMNMKVIKLETDNHLDEVVINAITPVTIKKDTVAYNTKAFKIRTDDSVEDLLKKLPGVEVDASGKVTAQGEEVSKIYVDGKEFFSGDPTIATKNLSADAIKSIEVIDEKSEESRVSGVNDSERKKVINLKLKDDKKVNDFGKFQGGYGTDDRYLTSLNYNRFSSKLQTSIIGKFNNVNTTGSDISEIIVFNTGGGRSFSRGSGSPSSGFVTTGVGGLNLGYEFKEKQTLNADYFYNYTKNTTGDVFTKRTEFIGDREILSEIRRRSENVTNSHATNFSYRDRSKKLSSLSIRGSANRSKNEGNSINTMDKYNGDQELDLQSISSTDNNSTRGSGNVNYYFTKRFNEDSKRHITTSGSFSSSSSSSTNNNDQVNKYNIADPDQEIIQKLDISREQDLDKMDIKIDLAYIEPVTDKHLIEVKGKVYHSSTDDDVNQSKYENDIIQNPLIYSQYYRNTNLTGSVQYKYDIEKFTFSAKAEMLNQTQDFGIDKVANRHNQYSNFTPSIKIRYRPVRGKFAYFKMSRDINLPSLNELSPVVNDFNPLFITKGNPDLTPEDEYAVSAFFINHNFSSGFSLFSRLSYSYIKNSIVNSEFTDSYGVRTTTFENLGDRKNFNFRGNLGNRWKKMGLRYNFKLSLGYNNYLSVINDNINETVSKDGTFGISLENNKKEKIDAMIGADWKKNYTTFTTGRNADRDYLQQTYYIKTDWNVTDRLNVNSQFKYDIYTDSNFGTDQSVPIWNASLSYALNQKKSLTLMLSALDILNKNIGIVRNSSDNYFEETHREVLGNYYMLSLTYNLNGNKNPNSKGGSRRMHRMH